MIAWIILILKAANAKRYLMETKSSKDNNTNLFVVETKNSVETTKSNYDKSIPGQGKIENTYG
jgi:hypothetical protein